MRVAVNGSGVVTAASDTLTGTYILFPINWSPELLIGLQVTGTAPNRLLLDGDEIVSHEVNEAEGGFTPGGGGGLSAIAAHTLLGNNTGSSAVPSGLTLAQVRTELAISKTDVGLSNVDNTSDANKPVSTATQTALDAKVALTTNQTVAGTKTFTDGINLGTATQLRTGAGSPEGVVTAPVGSTYQRTDGSTSTSLYVKESGSGNTGWVAHGAPGGGGLSAIAAHTFLGNNTGSSAVPSALTVAQAKAELAITKSDVGLSNVDNTTDANKPVSTAQQTALDGKQPLDPDLTAIAGLIATTDNMIQSVGSAWASRTPTQVKTALALSNVDNTADTAKPVSTAQQTALDTKVALTGNQTVGGTKTFTSGLSLGTATQVLTGTGSPNSAVTAPVGSIYLRTNGGAATTLYIKETGSGNTGWVAYSSTGTGSTPLVINVKDAPYNAAGDGTTNDTTAITNAIAAAAATHSAGVSIGGILYFPQGVYMTDGGHDIPAYVHIVGAEPAGRYWTYNPTDAPPSSCALKLRTGTSATAMFNIGTGSTAFSLRNISLLGNVIAGGKHGISFAASPTFEHNAIIENVAIIGFTGDGVRGRLFATRWHNMFIGSNAGWGLNCTGGSGFGWTDTWFSGSIIAGNVSGGVNFEATVHCGEISFTDCRIERSGWNPADADAPISTSAPGIRIAGVLIGAAFTNCSTDANSGNGLEITRAVSGPAMHHILFTACRFSRDGFGTMAGGSAGNFAAVKIAGSASYPIQYIEFANCMTLAGHADDGGTPKPSYYHAKYGLWWDRAEYCSWVGGSVADEHPGGRFNFGDVWRPVISIVGVAGTMVVPSWGNADEPPSGQRLVGQIGYNTDTPGLRVFNGTSWATV